METTSKVIAATRFDLRQALGWELYKTCLEQELIDRAETELGLTEVECTAFVRVDGTGFVVTFVE